MNLETKCPHCDQWTASDVESCSKCGGLLFDSKEGANPFISSLKDNWKLAAGLAGAVLIVSVLFFRPNPTPPSEKQSRPGGSRGGRSRPAGPSVLPGALVLNDELTRFDAETLQDLVDAGLYDSMEDLQATAPDGTKWVLNPDGTVTTQRK